VLAGVIGMGFLITYYAGLSVSHVGIIVPIMQTSPLTVLAVSAVLLRDDERVTLRPQFSVLGVVLGAVTVTLGE